LIQTGVDLSAGRSGARAGSSWGTTVAAAVYADGPK
jgi:hypothetical protein